MNIIDRMWKSFEEVLYISKEQFLKSLEGYKVEEVIDESNNVVAAVISKGPSFHFITFGIKWKLNKKLLSKWPGSLIAEYGYAETSTPVEDDRQHRFNKRLGFFETGRDEQYVYYRIERSLT